MELHTTTLGHVALAIPATPAMESAEEECETIMLRCRHGTMSFVPSATMLGGLLPHTDETIYNPGTLRDLADIFETNLDQAFTHWGSITFTKHRVINA